MKSKIVLIIYFFITEVLLAFTSKKELSCKGCKRVNMLPIVNAGLDQTIIFPIDSIFLDGSASSDPDGKITGFQWRKFRHPEGVQCLFVQADFMFQNYHCLGKKIFKVFFQIINSKSFIL